MEDSVFVNANDEFLRYFNIERDRLVGRSEEKLGLGLEAQTREQINSMIKNEGQAGTYETQIRLPSGEARNILASVQYIRVDHTDALITAFIDITDRVRAEQQIRSLAYDLTMAEQEERRRISQILHDDLQQRIFAVKMQLSTLSDAYQKGNIESTRADFAQLQEGLNESISITRNLSMDLSPAILQGDSLNDALIWLASQMDQQYQLKVQLAPNSVIARFDDTLRILLFQAAREILFNIVKHADTIEATISLEHVDRHTRLTIRDGGKGFAAQEVLGGAGTSSGLRNLQHRLNLMGCSLEIKSQPDGTGTQVIIDIPSDK
jgi:PAS domain S-box-containing protein